MTGMRSTAQTQDTLPERALSAMDRYRDSGLELPGDGIAPEIVARALIASWAR